MKRGFAVLRDKALNRSITFGRRDRDRLGLRGLLPHRVATDRQMVHRVMANLQRMPRDIDRYMLLSSLQERNERLFYQTSTRTSIGSCRSSTRPRSARPAGSSRTSPGTRRASSSPRTIADRSAASWPTGPPKTSASSSSPTESEFWAWAISAPMAWASRWGSLRCTPRVPASIRSRVCR